MTLKTSAHLTLKLHHLFFLSWELQDYNLEQ